MSNPSQLLEELSRLETLRDPQAGQSLRQFERHVIRGDAELTRMDRAALSQSAVAILLRDISRGGLGFISPQPLEAGTTWQATFLQHRHAIGEQAVVIRHCRNVGDGVFLVGAQFCAASGLMALLGVPSHKLRDNPTPTAGGTPPDQSASHDRKADLAGHVPGQPTGHGPAEPPSADGTHEQPGEHSEPASPLLAGDEDAEGDFLSPDEL